MDGLIRPIGSSYEIANGYDWLGDHLIVTVTAGILLIWLLAKMYSRLKKGKG